MYVGGDLRQRASERKKGEMGKKRHREAAWLCCCLAASVVSNSVRPHGPQPARLLCPWGFSRQEYWSELPCPPPGDLPDPGIKRMSIMSPALAGGFFTTCATWEVLSWEVHLGQKRVINQRGSKSCCSATLKLPATLKASSSSLHSIEGLLLSSPCPHKLVRESDR